MASFLEQFLAPLKAGWKTSGKAGDAIVKDVKTGNVPGLTKDAKKGKKAAATPSSTPGAPPSDSALLQLLQGSGLYDTGQATQQNWMTHHPLAAAFAQQHGINLLGQGAGQAADPLSQQLFFFQTIAPYLNQIQSQTQSLTGPLYAKAAQQVKGLPGQYQSAISPFLSMMQAGDANLQGALAGSAAIAPSLDALMQNVSAERQAQQKAYYESLLAKTAGAAGGTAGNPFGLTLPST